MLDIGRTDNFLQADELGDGCHLTAIHLNKDVLQRLRIEAILRRGSCHDTVDLTKLVEVTDIRTTAVRAECVEYHFRCHTRAVALGCIHINLILRETF